MKKWKSAVNNWIRNKKRYDKPDSEKRVFGRLSADVMRKISPNGFDFPNIQEYFNRDV
jgi:hypothetical protein